MSEQGERRVLEFSVVLAWKRRSAVAVADDAERGAGVVVGGSLVLGGVTSGRGLAAGIRDTTVERDVRRAEQ
jgi:hypothetical protein